jgi:hypothetical protein
MVETKNRRCFGRAKDGELYCYRDQHRCQNVDPPIEDWDVEYAYTRAASDGDWATMQRCLLFSPLVSEHKDGDGHSATHLAILGEHVEIVKELFRRNLHNDTPLYKLCRLAVRSGNLEMVRGFIGKDNELFAPNIREELLYRALRYTVVSGHLHILVWFWKEYPLLVSDFKNSKEQNILMLAAIKGHPRSVEWILSQNINSINVTDIEDRNVLDLIVRKKAKCNFEIVKMLVVDGRAQLNDSDEHGISSFFTLLPYIDESDLAWMIDGNYVDVEQTSLYFKGESIYHFMLRKCKFKMIRFFVERYNPSRKIMDENERWRDFFSIAQRFNNRKDNLDATRWLVKNNYIEVNKKRPIDGSTPLVAVCRAVVQEEKWTTNFMDYLEVIRKLVEIGGANIDICDNLGKSAWDHLLPLWRDIELMRTKIVTVVLLVFLPRSLPPEHVETVLLSTRPDWMKRGRRVHHVLVARRQQYSLLLGNSSETMAGLPNDLIDIVSSYDDNMSTLEMWNILDDERP